MIIHIRMWKIVMIKTRRTRLKHEPKTWFLSENEWYIKEWKLIMGVDKEYDVSHKKKIKQNYD